MDSSKPLRKYRMVYIIAFLICKLNDTGVDCIEEYCGVTISLYSKYRSGTIEASLALCKSSNQKYWSIEKSWDYNGPGYNGATSAFSIIKNRYVESGYYYKVTFVVDVYDSNGTYIETLRATSDVLYV